jgi:hypothetical protein
MGHFLVMKIRGSVELDVEVFHLYREGNQYVDTFAYIGCSWVTIKFDGLLVLFGSYQTFVVK